MVYIIPNKLMLMNDSLILMSLAEKSGIGVRVYSAILRFSKLIQQFSPRSHNSFPQPNAWSLSSFHSTTNQGMNHWTN